MPPLSTRSALCLLHHHGGSFPLVRDISHTLNCTPASNVQRKWTLRPILVLFHSTIQPFGIPQSLSNNMSYSPGPSGFCRWSLSLGRTHSRRSSALRASFAAHASSIELCIDPHPILLLASEHPTLSSENAPNTSLTAYPGHLPFTTRPYFAVYGRIAEEREAD